MKNAHIDQMVMDKRRAKEQFLSPRLPASRSMFALDMIESRSFLKEMHPLHHSKSDLRLAPLWRNHVIIAFSIASWYVLGFISIITTKILLTDWKVPPLLLTFQQLLCGSMVLYVVLLTTNKTQPWPWDNEPSNSTFEKFFRLQHADFILTGLFNSLDFLASNTAFSQSAASFVETVKASEPITTSAAALAYGLDRVERKESIGLSVLVLGVLLSTWGNAESTGKRDHLAVGSLSLTESVKSSLTIMTANLCFALRATCQKFYRKSTVYPLDDANLLCKMQQLGAVCLFFPTFIFYGLHIWEALVAPMQLKLQYACMLVINTIAFSGQT